MKSCEQSVSYLLAEKEVNSDQTDELFAPGLILIWQWHETPHHCDPVAMQNLSKICWLLCSGIRLRISNTTWYQWIFLHSNTVATCSLIVVGYNYMRDWITEVQTDKKKKILISAAVTTFHRWDNYIGIWDTGQSRNFNFLFKNSNSGGGCWHTNPW